MERVIQKGRGRFGNRPFSFLTLAFFLFTQVVPAEAGFFSAQSRLKAPSAASASDGAGRSLIDSIRQALTDRKATTSTRDGGQRVMHYELSSNVGLTVDTKAGIATLSYRRAPMNYLNTEMYKAMTQGIQDHVKWNPRIRMLLFDENSAGTDIPEHLGGGVEKVIPATSEFFRTLESLAIPKGTLVKPGYLLGGGLEVALMTDVIVAVNSPKVRLGSPEVKLGALAPYAAILLPRRLGVAHVDEVMKWLMSGNFYNLEEAKAIGLVDAVGRDEEEAKNILVGKLARLSERMPYISRVAGTFSNPVPLKRFLIAGEKEIARNQKGGIALSRTKERYVLPDPILHLFLIAVEIGLKQRDFDTALTRVDELFLETAMGDRHLHRYPELEKAVREWGISPSRYADYGFRYFMANKTMPTDWRTETVGISKDGGDKTQDEERELVSMGFDLLAPDYDQYDLFLEALATSLQMNPFQLHERLKALGLGKDEFVTRSPLARARAEEMAHRQTARLSREDDGTVRRTLNPFIDLYAVLGLNPAEHPTKHIISTRFVALVKRADRMRGNAKREKLDALRLAHNVLVNRDPRLTREEYDAQYRKEKGLGEFRARDGGRKAEEVIEIWDTLLTQPLPRAKNRDDLRELQEIRQELVSAERELNRRLGRLFRQHFWNLDLPISSIAYDEGIDLGEYAARIQERLEAVDLKIDVIGGKLNKRERRVIEGKTEPSPKPDKSRLRKLLKGSLPTDPAGLETLRAELAKGVAIVDTAIGEGIRELWHIGVGRQEHQYGEVVGINAAIEGTLEKRHPGLNLKETGDALDVRIAEIDTRSRFASDGGEKLGVVSIQSDYRLLPLAEFSQELERLFGGIDFTQGITPEIASQVDAFLASLDVNDPALLSQLQLNEEHHQRWGYTRLGLRTPEGTPVGTKNKSVILWAAGYKPGDYSYPHLHESDKEYLYEAYVPAVGPIRTEEFETEGAETKRMGPFFALKPVRSVIQEPGDGQVYREPKGSEIHRNGNPGDKVAWLISLYVRDTRSEKRGAALPEFHPLLNEEVEAVGLDPEKTWYRIVAQDGGAKELPEANVREIVKRLLRGEIDVVGAISEIQAMTPPPVSALFSALLGAGRQGDPYHREMAAALGKKNDPHITDALLIGLEDDFWSIRYLSAEALGNSPEPRAFQALLAALDKEEDPEVLASIATALGNSSDPRILPALSRALERITDSRGYSRTEQVRTVLWKVIKRLQAAKDGDERQMAPVNERANYLLTHYREPLEARIRGDLKAPPSRDFQMMMKMEQLFSDEPEFDLMLAFGNEAGVQIHRQILDMRSKAMRLHNLVGYEGILDSPEVRETASSILADLGFLASLQETPSQGSKKLLTSRFALDQIKSFVHGEAGSRIVPMREARRPLSDVSPGLEAIGKPGAVILWEALLRDATLVERLRTWPKNVPLVLVSPSWKVKEILDQIAIFSKGQQTLPLSTFAAVITAEATYTSKDIFSHDPSFNISNARDIIEAAEFVTEQKVVAFAVEDELRDAYEEALPNGFKIVYQFSKEGTGKATLGAGAFNELLRHLALPDGQQKLDALRGTILMQPVQARALGDPGEYYFEFDEGVRRL